MKSRSQENTKFEFIAIWKWMVAVGLSSIEDSTVVNPFLAIGMNIGTVFNF